MSRGTLWHDEWGMLRIGWIFALIALLVVIVFAIVKPIDEANCNAKAERLNSPLVVDADHDFWANECYVTLTDGRVIPLSQHRTIEHEEVIR